MRGMYTYMPLQTTKSPRVLKNRGAADPSQKIVCYLVETDLDAEDLPYDAISYTWERQSSTQEIEVDNKAFLVTRNCEAALRRLRPTGGNEASVIWIDSVCIDQNDNAVEERNNQVSIMGQIYAKAETVFVWLHHSRIDQWPRHRIVAQWLRDLAGTASVKDEKENYRPFSQLVSLVGSQQGFTIRGQYMKSIPMYSLLTLYRTAALHREYSLVQKKMDRSRGCTCSKRANALERDCL